MRYHCTSIRMDKIKSVDNTICWEDVEQLEYSHIDGERVWTPWEIVWQFLRNLDINYVFVPVISLLHIYPRKMKTWAHKNMQVNVYSKSIHNCKKIMGNNPDVFQQVNGYTNCVYPFNGRLLSNKQEQTIDTCKSSDESQRHYAGWKKPTSKKKS